MIRLTFCLRRKPGISREEFQRYWKQHHGPLMQSNMRAFDALTYQQMHTVAEETNQALKTGRDGPDPYDGIAEVYWRDLKHFSTATGTKDARRAGRQMIADEQNFIDLARSPIFLTEVGYTATGPGKLKESK